MLPAIFAVLLLSPFVASNIYVGQYPQNVDAVVKDPSTGNLVPVTGVADTIEVVDLNYGGNITNNVTGMAIDISVTPVNASGASSVEYPSLSGEGYPSAGGISLPMSSGLGNNLYTPPSAEPVSLPSNPPMTIPTAMPGSFPSSGGLPPSAGFPSSVGFPPSGGFPSGGFPPSSGFFPPMPPSGNPMLPSGGFPPMPPFGNPMSPTTPSSPSAPITPFPPFSGLGSTASPPTAWPFAPPKPGSGLSGFSNPATSAPSAPSSDDNSHKPSKPSKPNRPPPFDFFGGGKKKKKSPGLFGSGLFGPGFLELDGSLGPVVTSPPPTVSTSSASSVPKLPTQDGADYSYPSNSDVDDGISSFLNNFSPLDSLKGLLFPSSAPSSQLGSATENYEDSTDPLSFLTNFAPSMNENTGSVVPLNLTNFTSRGSSLNSFPFNILNSTFPQWNNFSAWNFTSPFFNSTQIPLNFTSFLPVNNNTSFSNIFSSVLNNSSLFGSFLTPFMGSSGQNTLRNAMSGFLPSMFGLNSFDYDEDSEFDDLYPDAYDYEEPEYFYPTYPAQSSAESLPSMYRRTFRNPSTMSRSQSSLISPLLQSNSESPFNSLLSMMNSLLAPSKSGTNSLFSSLFPTLGNATPSSSLLFSPINLTSLFDTIFAPPTGSESPLSILGSLVDTFLTPLPNGTTPFSSLVTDEVNSLNNTSQVKSELPVVKSLLGSLNFTSTPPFNLSSPFSLITSVLSSLSQAGMLPDISNITSLVQNMSALYTEDENNPNVTRSTQFWKQGITDFKKLTDDLINDFETFISSINNTQLQSLTKAMNLSQFESLINRLNTSQLSLQLSSLANSFSRPSVPPSVPSKFPKFFPLNKFPSKGSIFPSLKPTTTNLPSQGSTILPPQPPVINLGSGSSFLAMPSMTDGMLSDAPATDTTPTLQPSQDSGSTNVNDPGIVDYASPPTTTTPPPPVDTGSNTTPTSASGVNIASTWIILTSVLAAILGQKKFM